MSVGHHRKIYIDYYGSIPKEPNGRSYEIHHIDGNHDNNDINNLQCVTIKEHYDIHWTQGDYCACVLISLNMKLSSEKISELRSLAQQKRIENGTHNFLGGKTARQRVKAGTHNLQGPQTNKKRIENGTHNFLHPKIYECPYCGKIGKGGGMFTRHFDNCKMKEKIGENTLALRIIQVPVEG